jgi:hypothetical protein
MFETRRFTNVIIRQNHQSESSEPIPLRLLLILSPCLHVCLPDGLHPSDASAKTVYVFVLSSILLYGPAFRPWLYHPNILDRKIKCFSLCNILHLHIMAMLTSAVRSRGQRSSYRSLWEPQIYSRKRMYQLYAKWIRTPIVVQWIRINSMGKQIALIPWSIFFLTIPEELCAL